MRAASRAEASTTSRLSASRTTLCLRLRPPPRSHRPRCEDRLPQRALKLEASCQRLARSLAPVAELGPGEREVIARLVDEPPRDAQIEQLAHRVDADSPADLELGFTERRRTFVLGHLDPGAAPDGLVADLHLP